MHAEGLYINKNHRGSIRAVLDNWPEPEVDIIVSFLFFLLSFFFLFFLLLLSPILPLSSCIVVL